MRQVVFFLFFIIGVVSIKAGDGKQLRDRVPYPDAPVVKTDSDITFIVDRGLKPVAKTLRSYEGKVVAAGILDSYNVKNASQGTIAQSFANDTLSLIGKDVLFRSFVHAYGEHRPLVLSPDMIWLNICQVFGHYVHIHAEELRDTIVYHDGVKELALMHKVNPTTGYVDWPVMIDDFVQEISKNTKGDVAQILSADFSTSSPTERVAFGITVMDIMKPYFRYREFAAACGIPYITLRGTTDDWQRLLDKTMLLERYGMGWWTVQLRPILQEFINASRGEVNVKFWKSIVMKHREKGLFSRGGCFSQATLIDGWVLQLFPYTARGTTPKKVVYNIEMMPAMVKADLIYEHQIEDDTTESTPMELWAGFVGVVEDRKTHALTPKIGWMIREADSEASATQPSK